LSRAPPIKELMARFLPYAPGKCCWCGESITEKTPTGRDSKASWHPACLEDFRIISWPNSAREAVRKRDFDYERGILPCSRCGNDCQAPLGQRLGAGGRMVEIAGWHVDHRVPLWKVEQMPALERIEYYRLGNLVVLCFSCHTIKSAEEAAERAHFKRLRKPKEKGASKWPSRSMGHPRLRKKMNGDLVRK
jgi:5-methylcytosine-specific restriction endonuclease McrA